jgi:methylenetetrahydrofolate dehydrogenase (NADP+)/methenyltetrahydrofolate cyclohydrolase
MKIIDGKNIAEEILFRVKEEIDKEKIRPVLKIFNIGSNPASLIYIKKKKDRGFQAGIKVEIEQFEENAGISAIKKAVSGAGREEKIHGIIIQLPIIGMDMSEIFQEIAHQKDVDGLNPLSLGLLWQNDEQAIIPATPNAIIKVLEFISREEKCENLKSFLSGKNILIINRSIIIGKPLAAILINNDATVTIAHSKTKDIGLLIAASDIVISATGQAGFINNYVFKKEIILIDAGFNFIGGKSVGDIIITPEIEKFCTYLSPVPNGVGPIGVACLLENTLLCAKNKYL